MSMLTKVNCWVGGAVIIVVGITFFKDAVPAWTCYLAAATLAVVSLALMKYGNELCSYGLLKQRSDIRSFGRILLLLCVALIFLGYTIALTPESPGFQP